MPANNLHHPRHNRRRRRLSRTDYVVFQGTQEFPPRQPQESKALTENTPAAAARHHHHPKWTYPLYYYNSGYDASSSTIYSSTAKDNNITIIPPPKQWTLIHIPKTAGDSFMEDSPNHMPINSTLQGNEEKSLARTPNATTTMTTADRTTNDPQHPFILFLRKPTSMVLSLFLECKYDDWGRRTTKDTGFPGYDQLEDALAGFDEWIEHFASQHLPSHSTSKEEEDGDDDIITPPQYGSLFAFKCYDPYNMMSRYLTMEWEYEWPHFATEFHHRFPDAARAIQNLHPPNIAVVGIVEYYAASLCLFEYHAGGKQFLTRECQTCVDSITNNTNTNTNNGGHDRRPQQLLVGRSQSHNDHNVPPHSVKMISNRTLRMIADSHMTRVDQQLYQAGLELFLEQIEEVYHTTGVDLLCRPERRTPTTTTTITPGLATTDFCLSIMGIVGVLAFGVVVRRRQRRDSQL